MSTIGVRGQTEEKEMKVMYMDEITRVIKELFWLLQNVNIAEEDYKVGIGIEERIEEIKQELGSWFIDGYQLYQGS